MLGEPVSIVARTQAETSAQEEPREPRTECVTLHMGHMAP